MYIDTLYSRDSSN